MRQSTIVLLSLLILPALAACSRRPAGESNKSATPAAQRISSESLVKAEVQPLELPADGSADAIVKVTVQNGYHINANPASFPYLIATELDIPETEDISVNYTYYPNPLVKKFSFADQPLRVYEGETPITVALLAAKTAAKGQRSLAGTLRIQACDDQVCYPPGSIAVAIPVLVK
jgi:thioredoxin:protein disulfide reductase